MQFNEIALAHKHEFLDSILGREDLLRQVLAAFSDDQPYEYSLLKRPWEPGGGSSLFSLSVGAQRSFLKVKRCEVLVESKLEGEEDFSNIPSLRNEFEFLQRVKDLSPNTPQLFEYVELEGYGFLFLEHLSPFSQVVSSLDASQLLSVYRQIEETARRLFAMGIVHTDIHEENIAFRDKTPVLIDFEEARFLAQDVPFEQSLDVIGQNGWGNVGEMPTREGTLQGPTCLSRLKRVIQELMLPKLQALVNECNFDSACPYLKALDHGEDERIYQSIKLPGFQVAGQRPLEDRRIDLIAETARQLFGRRFTHLDIGSNIGIFNLELDKRGLVDRSIGVEAYERYVSLAKVLAFLNGCSRAEFLHAECGVDSLSELLEGASLDLVTIYSVFHHIPNREAFLQDLRRLAPSHLMLEMAVQPECYDGRSWEDEVARICQLMGMRQARVLAFSEDYQRPIVLVSGS